MTDFKEFYEQEYNRFRFTQYGAVDHTDTPLMAFISGYLYAQKENTLERCIRLYLSNKYQIDGKWNSWKEQIDHYAFLNNEKWDEGFFRLIHEIHNDELVFEEESGIAEKDEIVWEQEIEVLDRIHLQDGTSLEVGDVIQLADKIDEDYRQTKFYDVSLRNPNWELFYPSEKDFDHVYFYISRKEGVKPFTVGRVRRLFSNTLAKIELIGIQKGQLVVYTDLFKIEIEKALQIQEVKLIKKNVPEDSFINFISFDLVCFSCFTYEDLINQWSFFELHCLKKEWERYNRNVNGFWYKRS
ncbi:hypothetical protein QNI19_05850 [Cytophagaceae bacterium DM2B3-1]|uniref:Uncharacterized protein n=1 Tax=Xanthocytophaga flava TaxID=3048013 RepID=A0ABT7CIE6_9BACT|nr:hypothetical protein [Xanthocytophaga flavus]MDJ1470989.1 hypothetical protein [Xanthocytophaga flavus]MDJ1492444.1 hypothetical protein [Xanthocytophaga flavus]